MRSNLHASAVSCRLRSPKMKWICRQASEHKIVLVDCAITFRCRMLQTFCYSVQTVPVACCRVSAPFTPSAQKPGQIVVIEDDQVVGGGMGRNAESHSRWGDTAKVAGAQDSPVPLIHTVECNWQRELRLESVAICVPPEPQTINREVVEVIL